MDLNSVNFSVGAGTLTIKFGAINLGPTPTTYNLRADIGGTLNSGATLLAQDLYDPANGVFAGSQVASLGTFSGPGFFGGTTFSSATGGQNYSLTKVVTLTHGGVSTSSFNFMNATVPEPASLLLLGSGMAAVGLLRRRRRVD